MKKLFSGLLCLILALSMMLFVACEDQVPDIKDPEESDNNQTPPETPPETPPDDTPTAEVTSAYALSAMKAELEKKDCLGFTTSIAIGEDAASAVQIGTVTVKVDAEGRMFAAVDIHLDSVLGLVGSSEEETDGYYDEDLEDPERILRVEVYVVESGVYAGTNTQAMDENGNSLMTYYAVPEVTSTELKQICAQLAEKISGADDFDIGSTGIIIPGFDTDAIFGDVKKQESLTKTETGYIVSGSVDLASTVNTLLTTVKRVVLPLAVNQLVEMLLPKETVVGILDTLSEKTVSDVLLLLDDAIGSDIVNTVLAELTEKMGLTLGDTPAEVRTSFETMLGEQDLIALVLSMMDADAGESYAALTTAEEKHSFFVLLVSNLYQQIPTTKVGDLEISEGLTVSDVLASVKTITALRASASLALSETFLPTALHAEAAVDITIDEQRIQAAVVTDTTFTFEVGAITLPETLLLAPMVTDSEASWSYDPSDDGATDYVTFSTTIMIDAESFEISEATISVAGLAEDAYFSATPAVIDAETGTVTIQATYATDDKTGEGVPTVEITLTATVGDSTVYVLITEEY